MRYYFDRSTPERLQEECFFIIEYYLGTRGREWIRYLKKENIKIETDSQGKTFIEIKNLNTMQKNCQPAVNNSPNQNLKQCRIYATDIEGSCPVEAMKLLLQRLPDECCNLFYKPMSNWHSAKYWYNPKMVYGIHKIGDMMKQISIKAKLSKTYTSHCVRSTVVTNLFNKGFAAQDIQCVTGHRNENSVKRYIKRVDDNKKQSYAAALHQSMMENADEPAIVHATKQSSSLQLQTGGSSISISSDVTVSAPSQMKKMKLTADGNKNIVTITFE